jgi:hypothetical protein
VWYIDHAWAKDAAHVYGVKFVDWNSAVLAFTGLPPDLRAGSPKG